MEVFRFGSTYTTYINNNKPRRNENEKYKKKL